MRVLLISNMYPNKENPQFGIFVKNCEEILLNNDIVVDKIVCTKKKSKISKILQYVIFYIKILFRLLTSNYSCIYVHYLSFSSLPIIVAKKLKKNINIVSNVHGSDVIPENRKHAMLNNLSKKCAEISSKIIVPSNYYKNVIIERWKIKDEKIKVFPSGGINKDIFRPKDNILKIKDNFNLDLNYKYIGFVSRLDKGKGWDILLDAINDMKDEEYIKNYKFIFVGNGKEEELFKEKVEELNIKEKIVHINFLEHSKLSDLYNSLDLFCFPTMRDSESLGLVGIEALACGIPVVASNFAGPTDYIINNYNGYLFKKGDYKDLSIKLKRYISLSKDEKVKMKSSAYESSMKYWSENVQKDLINIFNEYKN